MFDDHASHNRGPALGRLMMRTVGIILAAVTSAAMADSPDPNSALQFIEMHREDVDGVGSKWIVPSADGRFLYVSGRDLLLFSVNEENGTTEHVLTYQHQRSPERKHGFEYLPGLYMPGAFAITPDGKQAYAGGVSLSCFERDAKTGRLYLLQELRPEFRNRVLTQIESIAISADGSNIYAIGASSHTLAVFRREPASGALTRVEVFQDDGPSTPGLPARPKLAGASIVSGLEFPREVIVSPDDKHVYTVSYSDRAITVFSRDQETGQLSVVGDVRGREHGLTFASGLAISNDGRHVYSVALHDGITVFARDAKTGLLTQVQRLINDSNGIESLAYAVDVAVSPNGQHVFAAASTGKAIVSFARDPQSGRLTFAGAVRDEEGGVDGLSGVSSLCVSPNNAYVYAASREQALTVFAIGGEPRREAAPELGEVSRRIADDATPFHRYRPVHTLRTGTQTGLAEVSFLSDGTLVAVTYEGEMQFWDAESGKMKRKIQLPPVLRNVAISPDGKLATAETKECRVDKPQEKRYFLDVWSLETGEQVHRLWHNNHGYFSTRFTPDSRYLAESRGDSVRIWSMESGEVEATIAPDGQLLPFGHIAFSEDGKRMVTGDMDGTLSFWEWRSGRRVASLKRSLNMSPILTLPQGPQVAAVDDKIRVYNATEGTEIMKFPVDADEGPPANLAVSSDGRLMAAAAWQAQSILIHSSASGKVLLRIPENESPGHTVHRKLAFAPTGSVLAVGIRDVQLWRLSPVDEPADE